jgi:hypothetical protein
MEYARHYAEGSKRAPDGATMRDHWLASGSDVARAKLLAPEFPDELEYLWGWALELHGRSGVSMAGLNPLTFQTIEAWARLTGRSLLPQEVEGLILLDSALRPVEEKKPDPDEPPVTPPWPTPKADA